MMAVGTAVIGSLQFGYNTGVINAPQNVSTLLERYEKDTRLLNSRVFKEMCQENNQRKQERSLVF